MDSPFPVIRHSRWICLYGSIWLAKHINREKKRKERKRTKWQTITYTTLHRNRMIEQYEPHWKSCVKSGVPEGWTQVFRRINSYIPEGWTHVFRKDELRYSGRISYSFSNSGTRRVAFVASPLISRDWGLWLRQTEHIRGKLWHIFRNGQPIYGSDRTTFDVQDRKIVLSSVSDFTILHFQWC